MLKEAIPDRNSAKLQKDYLVTHNNLCKKEHKPKMCRLDNEISADCTTMVQHLDITIQLVPPYDHRRNLVERNANI